MNKAFAFVLMVSLFLGCSNTNTKTTSNRALSDPPAGSKSSKGQPQNLTDGYYIFQQIADYGLHQELFFQVTGNQLSGDLINWQGYGHSDPEFSATGMEILSIKGTINGSDITIRRLESMWGADLPNDHVRKYGEEEAWRFENDQLLDEKNGLKFRITPVKYLDYTRYLAVREKVDCKEQESEDDEEGLKNVKICTFAWITTREEREENSSDCKLGCYNTTYNLETSEGTTEVSLEGLFQGNSNQLLSQINKGLKKDFAALAAEHADCFEDLSYSVKDFQDLRLTLLGGGFHFSAESGVSGYCSGVAGDIAVFFPMIEVAGYLRPCGGC